MAYFTHGKKPYSSSVNLPKGVQNENVSVEEKSPAMSQEFSSSGNLDKNKSRGWSVNVTTASNLEKAQQIILKKINVSLRHLFQQLGTSYGSAHTLVWNKLIMHPYKIQICQKLQPGDFDWRVQFSKWFLQKLEDPGSLGGLIMSDEAHFNLSGYINKQNMRFW